MKYLKNVEACLIVQDMLLWVEGRFEYIWQTLMEEENFTDQPAGILASKLNTLEFDEKDLSNYLQNKMF